MILITGPSGNVGTELVRVIGRSRGGTGLRLASRRPGELIGEAEGAELCYLDFDDRSTWAAALRNVEVMFLLFPLPGNRAAREVILPFVHAAEQSGCRHVVYVSVPGAEKARVIPHFKVEAALRASSMTCTVLRCGFFMQNLHRLISSHGVDIVDRGELFIPAGRGRTSFLDARDAADVAAAALSDPASHGDSVYHLTGPAALTMDEVARALSTALGFPVTYTDPSLLRFATRLRRRGVDWDAIAFMSGVYTLTRLGLNQTVTSEMEQLLSRPPRTFEEFLRDSVWRWREQAWT